MLKPVLLAALLAGCAHDGTRFTASEHRAADLEEPQCGTVYSAHILRDPLHRPRRDDPVVRAAVAAGEAEASARIGRAISVVNGCDR